MIIIIIRNTKEMQSDTKQSNKNIVIASNSWKKIRQLIELQLFIDCPRSADF